jgi:hypothetical protein
VIEDRHARLWITGLYRGIYCVETGPDDPATGRALLEAFLIWDGVTQPDAERLIAGALRAVERERLRGAASRSRRIVRFILAHAGLFVGWPAAYLPVEGISQRRVRLTDQRLRRILDAGDPCPRPERPGGTYTGCEVARGEDGSGRWMLVLERPLVTPKGGTAHFRATPNLVELRIPVAGPGLARKTFGPAGATPLGRASEVVRAWTRRTDVSAQSRDLGKLFLSRRK